MRLMRGLVFGISVGALCIGFEPRLSSAKAHDFWGSVDGLEAIVTEVETSDNPGDADWNILLRPTSPDTSAAFWSHFWKPSNDEWISDSVAPAFAATHGHFSEECKQCAGTGATGTACVVNDATYEQNPCPRIFGCNACLHDLSRVSGTALEDLTVKSEVFFGEDETENDLTQRLADAMSDLGFRDENGNTFSDEGLVCSEIEWEGGSYKDKTGKSNCGKKVWVSGKVSHDNAHDYRPEVHPLSKIVVDRGAAGNHVQKYRIGAFIDGSTDTIAAWSYDYHYPVVNLATSMTFDFSTFPFQGQKPPSCYSTAADGKCDLWVSKCDVDNVFSFHVNGVNDTAVTDRCPKRKVDLDFSKANGAAWISTAHIGWEEKNYSFDLNSAQVEPRGGILSVNAPVNYVAPISAGGVLRQQAPSCQPPQGAFDKSQLKRWYRWRVDSKASFPGIAANNVKWEFQKPTFGSKLEPEPAAVVPQPSSHFFVWMPAPSFDYPPYKATYEGQLRGTVKVNGAPTVWQTEEMTVKPPLATLKAVNAAVDKDQKFTANVVATVARLCGDSSKWKYTWTGPAVTAGWQGPGPHPISMQPADKLSIGVTVQDEWGVEAAVDDLVLIAPQLKLKTEVSCADSGTEIDYQLPRGWPGGRPASKDKLCKNTQVVAVASALPTGADAIFPESTVGKITYEWTDIKIALKDSATWSAPPAGWQVVYPDANHKTMKIIPPSLVEFYFQASVTGTDQYNRTATAHVSASNNFTPIATLADRLLKLWPQWRPGTVLPDPSTCPGCEAGQDRFAGELAQLVRRSRTAGVNDVRAAAALRHDMHAYTQYAFAKVGRERSIAYAKSPRATFTTRVTSIKTTRNAMLKAAHAAGAVRLGGAVRVVR